MNTQLTDTWLRNFLGDDDLPSKPSKPILSQEQLDAIAFAHHHLQTPRVVMKISGPAGSGKTTLIQELVEQVFSPVLVSAMTNKAKAVLISKGLPEAITFHQACMYPVLRPPLNQLDTFFSACEIHKDVDDCECSCPCSCADLTCQRHDASVANKIRSLLKITLFTLQESFEAFHKMGIYAALHKVGISDVSKCVESWKSAQYRNGEILVVDEASMLGDKDGLALAREVFDRIILIGDEHQLPPVKSEPVFWTVEPSFALKTIHRQAALSQPLKLATMLREGKQIPMDPVQDVDLELSKKGYPVIVWKNATREDTTRKIREQLGYAGLPPQPGETLICRNSIDHRAQGRGLFNNSFWKVIKCDEFYRCTMANESDEDKIIDDELIYLEEYSGQAHQAGIPFRFAYALTARNSQGSEWEKIMIHKREAAAMQQRGERSWVYTSVTRAKTEVLWVIDVPDPNRKVYEMPNLDF